MVELANQAFSTNNFDLAADVYERIILESGPSSTLYLGLADSCALGGHIRKAFDAYIKAYRLDNLPQNCLDNLVSALVNNMSKKSGLNDENIRQMLTDPFTCGACKSLWHEPITVKCGHTFCKRCFNKHSLSECKLCGLEIDKSNPLKVNVLLSKTIENWFPNEAKAGRLKDEANTCLQDNKLKEAIDAYNHAIQLVPEDHVTVSERSQAYFKLDMFPKALEDADHCILLKPDWAEGYYRKAAVLTEMSLYEEAAFYYLQCLSIDSSVEEARSALAASVHKLLSPVSAEQLNKHHDLQQSVTSHRGMAAKYPHDESPRDASSPSTSSNTSASANSKSHMAQSMQGLSLGNSLLHLRRSLRESLSSKHSAGVSHGASNTGGPSNSYRRRANSDGPETSATLRQKITKPFARIFRMRGSKNATEPKDVLPTIITKSSSDPCLCYGSPDIDHHTSTSVLKVTRKRLKEPSSTDPSLPQSCPSSPSSVNAKYARTGSPEGFVPRVVPADKLNKDDFECSLCYRLLYNSVTTPCGHSFCRDCLCRCLDYSCSCPLCKSSLVEHLAERRSAITESIEQILQLYFTDEYERRKMIHEEDLRKLARVNADVHPDLPLFVCTIAYPKVSCPLHVFEPRYRLMIRQCMESGSRQFGMIACMEEDEDNHAEYGTVLEIRDVQYFPDGRSVVDCVGGRRFKVLERGMRDGYHIANVKFLQDCDIAPEDWQETLSLHDEVLHKAQAWFGSIPGLPRQRILSSFGAFPLLEPQADSLAVPAGGPAWQWWLIAVLPLDPRAQLAILAMCSIKDRLLALRRVINFITQPRST